jgi:hypothetical protein
MLAYKSSGITLPRDQVKTHEVRAVPWSWNIFNSALYSTTTDPYKLDMKPCFSVAGCNCPEMDVRMFCGTNQIHN